MTTKENIIFVCQKWKNFLIGNKYIYFLYENNLCTIATWMKNDKQHLGKTAWSLFTNRILSNEFRSLCLSYVWKKIFALLHQFFHQFISLSINHLLYYISHIKVENKVLYLCFGLHEHIASIYKGYLKLFNDLNMCFDTKNSFLYTPGIFCF